MRDNLGAKTDAQDLPIISDPFAVFDEQFSIADFHDVIDSGEMRLDDHPSVL